MKCLRIVSCLLALIVAAPALAAGTSVQPMAPKKAVKEVKAQSTVIPVARLNVRWQELYNGMNSRVRQGNVDLVFIGDSITHFWEDVGMGVWYKFYRNRNAVDLGISGDGTEHVLWRLDHGNIDGISPKLAVVMIGTNNAGRSTAEQVAAGVKAIIEKLRAKLPQTKILLLAIFPRGPNAEDPIRKINEKTNKIISKLSDDRSVFYLDINSKFLQPDGKLSKEIMPDLLHPGVKGYEIWAEAIEPTVAKLMGEK
jgi:lysophospholipase L1-like esterase